MSRRGEAEYAPAPYFELLRPSHPTVKADYDMIRATIRSYAAPGRQYIIGPDLAGGSGASPMQVGALKDKGKHKGDKGEKGAKDKNAICKWFVHGRCKFADSCSLPHPKNLDPSHSGSSGSGADKGGKGDKGGKRKGESSSSGGPAKKA